MPKRIQRRRTRGWRMPTGAVAVSRPTKWGNPYKVGAYDGQGGRLTVAEAVRLFRADALSNELFVAQVRAELRGHDLACWCAKSDEWCHADVLLEIANANHV